jgi:hypothetical protein
MRKSVMQRFFDFPDFKCKSIHYLNKEGKPTESNEDACEIAIEIH